MALVLSLFLSFAELVYFVMNAPPQVVAAATGDASELSMCQMFCRALKEAFCGCCIESPRPPPPPPPPQQQQQRGGGPRPIPKTSVSVAQA